MHVIKMISRLSAMGRITLASVLPIFVIAVLLFLSPLGDFSSRLESFVDQYLLGRVGPWSPYFPMESKIIANYIAVAAPLFTVALIVQWRKDHGLPEHMLSMSWRQFVLESCFVAALVALVVFYSYFTYMDASSGSVKTRVYGQSRIFYPFFAAMMMLALEYLLLVAYMVFIHYPSWLLAQRRMGN